MHVPWQGFLAAAVAGIGTGFFWPAQSTLLASLSPPDRRHATFAMQRVMMNLGIGLGALVGGLIANVDEPGHVRRPLPRSTPPRSSSTSAVLIAPSRTRPADAARPRAPGSYGQVLRHGAFMAVVGLNTLFIFAGMSGFELLPVFAKNEAGVSETRDRHHLLRQHRRDRARAAADREAVGGPPADADARGARRPLGGMLGRRVDRRGQCSTGRRSDPVSPSRWASSAIGECIHGAVQAPLVSDLAEPRLLGRYMALSALSWQLGFALGPAVGGFLLAVSPRRSGSSGRRCAPSAARAARARRRFLERTIPVAVRRTPVAQPA